MTTISQAVAKQQPGPAALIRQYSSDFASVLPSHIQPDTWVRVAQGALKKGKVDTQTGKYELEVAAQNNPGAFLSALLDAARQGLEPGTDEYYLTPRKVKGRLEILGITGYQGYIELMYRAGAVASVVAELVYANDRFSYLPGVHSVPDHQIDWDAEDRGRLRLVYAYARMNGGATSKVVILNAADIDRIKKSAQGSSSEYSPWQTNEAAMWLKSAVRQLRKWVPTSAEYIREQARATAEVATAVERVRVEAPAVSIDHYVDEATGEVFDADVVEEQELPEVGD